jgi:hypothetical protein
MPRAIQGGSHLPECRVAERYIGQPESRSIGEVEELSSNLQLHTLANRNLFTERKIGVVDSVAAEIGKVPGGISSYLVSRILET